MKRFVRCYTLESLRDAKRVGHEVGYMRSDGFVSNWSNMHGPSLECDLKTINSLERWGYYEEVEEPKKVFTFIDAMVLVARHGYTAENTWVGAFGMYRDASTKQVFNNHSRAPQGVQASLLDCTFYLKTPEGCYMTENAEPQNNP